MSYQATWFKDDEVVAEDDFDDLIEAQAFIFKHMKIYHDTLGANGVRVWDGHVIYFGIENPAP